MVKRKYDKLFVTYRVTGLVGKPLVFLCFSCPLSFPPVFLPKSHGIKGDVPKIWAETFLASIYIYILARCPCVATVKYYLYFKICGNFLFYSIFYTWYQSSSILRWSGFMGLIFKNPLASLVRVREFSKSGEAEVDPCSH
jgi:hypothetical protein